jgi:predicted nuclease of predicted toxin-antitoxin system
VKLKLDENIGLRGAALLRAAGHDVATVAEQGLRGATDETLFEVCKNEKRALVTLDHDFGHVLRFPPRSAHGIVVLELPSRATSNSLMDRLRELITMLNSIPSETTSGLSSRAVCAFTPVIPKRTAQTFVPPLEEHSAGCFRSVPSAPLRTGPSASSGQALRLRSGQAPGRHITSA